MRAFQSAGPIRSPAAGGEGWMRYESIRDPARAMRDAVALLRVADLLDTWAPDREHPLQFRGIFLAESILLGLAAELALKALIMRSTGDLLKCHDLLDLFNRLPEDVKRRLEWRMPPIPGMPHLYPPVGIRGALEVNRNLFVVWRYLHERLNANAEDGPRGDNRRVPWTGWLTGPTPPQAVLRAVSCAQPTGPGPRIGHGSFAHTDRDLVSERQSNGLVLKDRDLRSERQQNSVLGIESSKGIRPGPSGNPKPLRDRQTGQAQVRYDKRRIFIDIHFPSQGPQNFC